MIRLLNVIALIFFFWGPAKSQMLVQNLKMQPVKALDKVASVNANCSESSGSLRLALFEDIDNIIVCKDTKTVIVNKLKLNTASRIIGDDFQYGNRIESKDRFIWVEVKQNGSHLEKGPRKPLTGCLDNDQGDGGSLQGTLALNVGSTGTLDLPIAFDSGNTLSGELDYQVDIGTTCTVTGSYMCTIPANSTGQVFFQPYYIEVDNPQIRYIEVAKGRTWKSPVTPIPKYVLPGEWETVSTKVRLNSLGSMPLITCVTDPEFLECQAELINDSYHF